MVNLRMAAVDLFAFAIAVATALIVLPLAALIDPVTRAAGAAFAHFAFFALADASLEDDAPRAAADLARFVWTVLVAVCVLPLATTALIGALARVRSPLWYAGATGVLAAIAPWAARAAFQSMRTASASPAELRFAFVFFLTGAAGGLMFWLIARRGR